MKYLPIGSIVQLNNGLVKVMIVSRYPLYDNKGKIGYFDYSGTIYPYGTAENRFLFLMRKILILFGLRDMSMNKRNIIA